MYSELEPNVNPSFQTARAVVVTPVQEDNTSKHIQNLQSSVIMDQSSNSPLFVKL